MYAIQKEQNTFENEYYQARAKHNLTCMLSSKSKNNLNMYVIQQEQYTS